ncbi:MAG: 2-oxoglutarate dehydrogenase complex dihydrolipoyllysine-residue succinyltransferase [Hyphomicrobiaceae bacterium]|nr:2-oxoglutarate dehydrogenase complex dihydrolipoyllysine-residue succinyltransferase [Hyphomicrobiaceae bacterium]
MAVEIRVPALGESVSEASVGKWLKKEGERVNADEPLVELETDKVSIEVPAPASGTISEISVATGDVVAIGAVLGAIIAGRGAQDETSFSTSTTTGKAPLGANNSKSAPAMPPAPAASKLMVEQEISQDLVEGSGRRGQVLKEDVLRVIEGGTAKSPAPVAQTAKTPAPLANAPMPTGPAIERTDGCEERVPMTRLRQTIARRLKEAQNNAAILTTFNEVDMSAVMDLRSDYKELFLKKHGTKLGFMGFFVKACVTALREIPEVNAEIDGTDLIYKNYYHIGVAVGTKGGLVVPVVRDADGLSLAGIESAISKLALKARDGKLSMDEMSGGTFTISNGGVYGSLMSTPILNAPQSGVLGMHKIEQRPVVVNGEITVRPMMYLALSYDHRIVDGKQAVTFLVRVKENIEDPKRMILEL